MVHGEATMRILVVEDDATARAILVNVLKKYGHDVMEAVDSDEAWKIMEQPGAPLLAILDWMMPGMEGPELCRRIREMRSDSPPYLILLTAKDSRDDIVHGLDAGADDYIAKPFDPSELRARVDVGQRMTEIQSKLVEAREAVVYEASHDSLTGVFNRRAFSAALSREISEGRRYHHGLALGICDVDRFKQVNDVYGHQAGDEVLCEIARRIENNLRGHDVLSRYGGDEFAILTEHIEDGDVHPLYERIRAAIAGRTIRTTAGEISVSVSFGVSIWKDQVSNDLFSEADVVLYRSKHDGGNRVSLFECLTT